MNGVVKLSELNDEQLDQAIDVFIEGFYNTLRDVSKDKDTLHKLFLNAFDDDMTFAYLHDGEAVGFLGIANSQKRPIKLHEETFAEVLGATGKRLYKAVSAAMEKIIVNDPDEMWLDYIATNPKNRSMGIGKKLLDYICANSDYKYIRLMVLSKNPRAISFYENLGFVKESEKFNLLVFLQGFGKEIFMKKNIERVELGEK